jgi:thioredoxin 1
MRPILITVSFLLIAAVSTAGTGEEGKIAEALKSGKPSLVDFGGESCTVCKEMKPVLDRARGDFQGKANVLFIDVWNEPDLGRKYRIQLIPTQIFYDAKGREVKRHIGAIDRTEIARIFAELGIK